MNKTFSLKTFSNKYDRIGYSHEYPLTCAICKCSRCSGKLRCPRRAEWKREETCFRSPIRLNEILLSHFLCWMMLSNLLMAERRRSTTVKRRDTDFVRICWRRFKGEEISSKRDVKLLHLWGSVKVASASIGTSRLFAAALASYAIKGLPNLIRCTTQHANYWHNC